MIEFVFMIYLLFILIDYILVKGDIMAPSFLFCAMYCFCFGCALINRNQWGLGKMNPITVSIFILGGIIFISTDIFCKKLFYRTPLKKTPLQEIIISKKIVIIIHIVCFAIATVHFGQVFRIAQQYSSSYLIGELLSTYRLVSGYRMEASVPGWAAQMTKIVAIFAYICLFVFLNNVVVSKKIKKNIIYVIPVLIYIASGFMTSNRLIFLNILGTSVIFYNLLQERQNNSFKRSIIRLLKSLLLFLGALVVFYLIRIFIGRTGSASTDIFTYLSKYVAGSVKLFDMFIDNPVHSDIWGKETFISLIKNLSMLNIVDIPQYLAHKEFRSYRGIGLGNVYTGYRCLYADFGYFGTMILHFIFAVFFCVFYYRVKSIDYTNYKKTLPLIIYGYVSSAIYLHPIDNGFYPYVICIGFLIYLVGFFSIYMFFFKRIRLKVR